jgi:hypothetical protein
MKSRIITLFIFLFYVSASNAAITFDGVDDYVTGTGNSQIIRTWSFWINPASTVNANSTIGSLLQTSLGNSLNFYFAIGAATSLISNEYFTVTNSSAGNYRRAVADGGSIPAGEWTHIAVIDTGSTHLIFFNGVQKSTIKVGSYSSPLSFNALRIGCVDGDGGGPRAFYNGQIEDVRIYNRALTETEIAILAKSPKRVGGAVADSSLVGHWEMEDNEIGHVAGRAQDETLNANHGSFTNFANLTTAFTSDTSPKSFSPNQSLIFDGVNDYLTSIGSLGSYAFIQNTARFTFSFWMKLASATNRYIIAGNTNSAGHKGFQLSFENGVGAGTKAIRIATLNSVAGGSVIFRTTDNAIIDTKWHHVVIVANGSADSALIFIDGEPVSITSKVNNALSSGNSSLILTIGSQTNGFTFPFGGQLDDFRIYDVALSTSNIIYLFTGGTSGTDPGSANLKGYWKLDDSTVQDSTGNNNHGIGLGAPVYSGNAINRN